VGRSSWTAERVEGGPHRAPSWILALVPFCLAAYFLMGYARIRTTDWVPFSAWALFVFVPNEPVAYGVKLRSAGDRVFDPPLDFKRADGIVANPHDIVSAFNIDMLGFALEKGDSAAADRYRGLLEANALPKAARWDLVRLDYDPVDRWKTGRAAESIVRSFGTGHD
jgi:hypothetical protein